MGNSVILGIGKYDAKHTVTNKDLNKHLLHDFGVLERRKFGFDSVIGIKTRRWETWHPSQRGNINLWKNYPSAGKSIFSRSWHFMHDELKVGEINQEMLYDSGMAYFAAKNAIENAGVRPKDIDLVIYSSSTPDLYLQQQSGKIAAALGIQDAYVQDLIVGCTGFFDGIFFADKLIKSGEIKTALVTGSNMISNYARWFLSDKSQDYKISYGHPGWYSAVIFGDGAGAAVITEGKHSDTGLLYSHGGYDIHDNPAVLPAGGSAVGLTHETLEKCLEQFYVHHGLVKKKAAALMERALHELLLTCKESGTGTFDLKDFDYFIPHQASKGVLKESAQRIGIEKGRMLDELENYGNLVCANLPVTMANQMPRLKEGTLMMFLVIGGGWKYGAGIYRCGNEFENMLKYNNKPFLPQ